MAGLPAVPVLLSPFVVVSGPGLDEGSAAVECLLLRLECFVTSKALISHLGCLRLSSEHTWRLSRPLIKVVRGYKVWDVLGKRSSHHQFQRCLAPYRFCDSCTLWVHSVLSRWSGTVMSYRIRAYWSDVIRIRIIWYVPGCSISPLSGSTFHIIRRILKNHVNNLLPTDDYLFFTVKWLFCPKF